MTQSEPIPPIGTQVSALAALAPDEPAVTCDGETLTRAELDSSTNRLARAYADRSVGVGDYVTILLPNSVEFVQAAVAYWKLGAVPQPLSARLPVAELQGLLDLRPRALLVGGEDPQGQIPGVPKGFTPDPTLSDAPLPKAVSPAWKAMGSGGSTGRPKLIEAGGDSRLSPLAAYAMGAQEGDTTFVPVPLSHNTGITMAALALIMGHHLLLMNRFDAHQFLRLISDHGVTFMVTVPTIMQRVLPVYHADPSAYDLWSIRRFWHLAAVCPPAVKQAWIDLLGPEKVWELYGGTELQALTFISGDRWLAHRGSVGIVVSGEMKVLDDDGNPCPPGVVGEIYMRPAPGSAPTYRYLGSTAKTRDGWDSLGDLGYFDADGFLYLSDRRVDMFTVGGRNVYPAEIESALSAHPEVLSCLVVGVPDPNAGDLGQVPYALVQRTDDSTLDAAGVREFLRANIAGYKVPPTPDFIEFVDTPLRDEAGKARRSAVRAEIMARLPTTEASGASGTKNPLRPRGHDRGMEIEPLSTELIERYLRSRQLRFFRSDAGAEFMLVLSNYQRGKLLVNLRINGLRPDILEISVSPAGYYLASDRPRLMELVNDWNRDTHWPKAFVRETAQPSHVSVAGESAYLLSDGIHLAGLGNFIKSTVEYGTDLVEKIEQAINLPSADTLEEWIDRTG